MSDDFYPFVDSGDPAPDNAHITGATAGVPEENAVTADAGLPQQQTGHLQGAANVETAAQDRASVDTAEGESHAEAPTCSYACRIAVYDDMLSTPRVLVIAPKDVRTYLEEITNTVYSCMKKQGGGISLMVIREIVENFIHAHFVEPIISILDDGNTIRFADQGPGIEDKERAFEFGVTSADREQKRYIRGTGAGFPMVQQYLENAGGAVSIEDNLHQGTVVTVSIDPQRVAQIESAQARGGAVRGGALEPQSAQAWGQPQVPTPGTVSYPPQATIPQGYPAPQAPWPAYQQAPNPYQQGAWGTPQQNPTAWPAGAGGAWQGQAYGYPPMPAIGMPGAMTATQPTANMPGMSAAAYGTGIPAPGAWAAQQAAPYVSDRGMLALQYLAQHGSCGPTDLSHAYGVSTPTWSRELDALAQAGLVIKRGQKRFLTEAGQIHLAAIQQPATSQPAPQQEGYTQAALQSMPQPAGTVPMQPLPQTLNTPYPEQQ